MQIIGLEKFCTIHLPGLFGPWTAKDYALCARINKNAILGGRHVLQEEGFTRFGIATFIWVSFHSWRKFPLLFCADEAATDAARASAAQLMAKEPEGRRDDVDVRLQIVPLSAASLDFRRQINEPVLQDHDMTERGEALHRKKMVRHATHYVWPIPPDYIIVDHPPGDEASARIIRETLPEIGAQGVLLGGKSDVANYCTRERIWLP